MGTGVVIPGVQGREDPRDSAALVGSSQGSESCRRVGAACPQRAVSLRALQPQPGISNPPDRRQEDAGGVLALRRDRRSSKEVEMLETLKRGWWLLVLRGICALLF